MLNTPHPAAEWVGHPKRPHQWQAVIASDGADGAGRHTHWRGDIHRTPEQAIAQAAQQQAAAAEGAPA